MVLRGNIRQLQQCRRFREVFQKIIIPKTGSRRFSFGPGLLICFVVVVVGGVVAVAVAVVAVLVDGGGVAAF